jgi:hypothetical protein
MRRGLDLARDTSNRANEAQLAICLASVEARTGDPMAALDNVTLAIRTLHDSGNTTTVRSPLAILSATFDGLGHYEQAAVIAGFAVSPFTAAAVPELTVPIDHLRQELGGPAYESLARAGEVMTASDMVAYAYDEIDKARIGLEAP